MKESQYCYWNMGLVKMKKMTIIIRPSYGLKIWVITYYKANNDESSDLYFLCVHLGNYYLADTIKNWNTGYNEYD